MFIILSSLKSGIPGEKLKVQTVQQLATIRAEFCREFVKRLIAAD